MSNDKLQRYALTAEIIGGLAVLVSLILLIVEVRENTESNRRASLIELTTSPLNTYVNSPDIQRIEASMAAIDNQESGVVNELMRTYQLSSEDANLYARYMGYLWRIREAEFLYGNPDLGLFSDNLEFFLRVMHNQIYWELNSSVPYDPEFRSFVNEIIESMQGK